MLPIVTGETTPVLIAKAAPVPDPKDPEVLRLLPQMVETMREAKGVGLAAPQIGKSIQVCVTETDGAVGYFINPEITTESEEKVVFEEGCLSLPGQFFPVMRAETITVKYHKQKGLPKRLRAEGFLAIVLQHEIDHLNGILIAERARRQKSKKFEKIYGRIIE
jgi:peptide deformylase